MLGAGFGFAGAAVAYSISNIMEVSLLLALMLYKQVQPRQQAFMGPA